MKDEHGADVDLPTYRCHKEVRAFKIASIEFVDADGSARIVPVTGNVTKRGYLSTKPDYVDRFKGGDDDPGYFVLYADGYESWSPTKAFEEGYTRVDG